MNNIIKVTEFGDPRLDVYVRLTGGQLRESTEAERGIFIAESATVVEVALGAGCEIISLLTDERLLSSEAVMRILAKCPDVPVYTAGRDLLRDMTGFELTRGVLAAIKRPQLPTLDEILSTSRRIAVFEGITDSTNIGALFRSAAALDVDAVLVTPTCCDPLCRRAVRVSMGTVLQVPYCKIGNTSADWPHPFIGELQKRGFKCAAMALTDDSVSIDDEALMSEERLAIILGTEGTGLLRETIEASDYTVKIPMSHGVDSLNVGAAGAVAFWQLCAASKRRIEK